MVIACPECSTKFRVNPERIPEQGVKVRCARCKHIFPVQKPVADAQASESIEPAISPAVPEPEESANISPSTGQKTEQVEERFSQIEDDLSAPAAEADFNYDQFRNLDQTPQEEETFGFSSDSKTDDIPAGPDELSRDDFTFGTEPDERAEASASTPEVTETGESTSAASVATDEEIAKAFSPDIAEEEPAVPETQIPAAQPQKSGPLASVIRVLLLLVLCMLIVGGVLYYMNGPEQFEQMIQQFIGQSTGQPAPAGKIALDKLEGKFIKNEEVGELFVIRGEAINKFKEPRASIQVKGVIFDHNGKSLLQKTIFCGNPISDQELQSLPFSKIEELMSNQFGKSLSNMNVNAEQAIPFIIVFRDLPKNLAEFSVNIASSEPATQ